MSEETTAKLKNVKHTYFSAPLPIILGNCKPPNEFCELRYRSGVWCKAGIKTVKMEFEVVIFRACAK
jgi:hypothetical protein